MEALLGNVSTINLFVMPWYYDDLILWWFIHDSSFKVDLDIIHVKRRDLFKQIPHSLTDSLN